MSALPKIKPCPKCGDGDQMSVYTYDSGATYVECTMDCGYRGPASTTARWAIRHHNAERDERARSYIRDREDALAKTRERLEKLEEVLREIGSNEVPIGLVRKRARAALTGDAQEAGE